MPPEPTNQASAPARPGFGSRGAAPANLPAAPARTSNTVPAADARNRTGSFGAPVDGSGARPAAPRYAHTPAAARQPVPAARPATPNAGVAYASGARGRGGSFGAANEDVGPAPTAARRPTPVVLEATQTIEVRANISRILFFDAKDGFTLAACAIRGMKGEQKIRMRLQHEPELGDVVSAHGVWGTYKGRSVFQAAAAAVLIPRNASGVSKWLKKGVDGVGAAAVSHLIAHFGAGLADAVASIDVLLTCPGISDTQARAISKAWHANQDHNQLMTRLLSFGLKENQCKAVLELYGAAFEDVLRDNPWALADIGGIGFRTADAIAARLGVAPDSRDRIHAGLKHVLDDRTQASGDCGLTKDALTYSASELLELSRETIGAGLDRFIDNITAVFDPETNLVYPRNLFDSETDIAEALAALMQSTTSAIPQAEAIEAVRRAERIEGKELDPSQFDAAVLAVMSPVSVITGGPGTGKSTVQRVICRALDSFELSLGMGCPTGKGAKRLAEASGRHASTLHSLLGYSATNGEFAYGKPSDDGDAAFGVAPGECRKLDYGQVIVDEFSMCDTTLGAYLLRAIPANGRLLLVGDVDQLPSVGPGQLLRDFIDSGVVPVARLTKPHRTAEDSGIAVAAHRIRQGLMPVDSERSMRGFSMRPTIDANVLDEVLDIVTNEVPAMGLDPMEDVMVLAGMKEVSLGVKELNAELKAALNPGREGETERMAGRDYSVGDVVMQMRNDRQSGIMNGETGRVVGFSRNKAEAGAAPARNRKQATLVELDFDGVRTERADDAMRQVDLAYAGTVHKSQGSEKPVVVLVLPRGHAHMMTRKLVYTGITRGKVQVYVVGTDEALARAIARADDTRQTGLRQRLQNCLAPEQDIDAPAPEVEFETPRMRA